MMTTDTREKILQVASKLIVRQGYTATSISQIAAETGIGKATVYHHFPDKEAIVYALLDRSSSRVHEHSRRWTPGMTRTGRSKPSPRPASDCAVNRSISSR